MYQMNVIDGYIVSVVKGSENSTMTESEYAAFRAALAQRPVPPAGFECRLRTDLTWDLFELPPATAEEE